MSTKMKSWCKPTTCFLVSQSADFEANWKAYDTFDGLSSPYASVLTFNHRFFPGR